MCVNTDTLYGYVYILKKGDTSLVHHLITIFIALATDSYLNFRKRIKQESDRTRDARTY